MKPFWTLDQVVSQLTKKQIAWGPTSVAYAFYTSSWAHHQFKINFSPFSVEQQQALARSMQLVSDVANITFHQVADNGIDPAPNNRRIGFYNVNSATYAWSGVAHNFWVDQATYPLDTIYGADVALNLDRMGTKSWHFAGSNQRILLHELLHTLGISHPGDYNGEGFTYANDALFYQDSHQYTVMSYWAASETGADHETGGLVYSATTPMLYDVAALQALYGPNMSTRTGDTVYGFNSTAGRDAFNLALHPYSIFTVWDAGGIDTLDLSGFASASRIDLRPGYFSDANGMTSNISIAHGAVIENAIGGSGNDVIHGNDANNALRGGSGRDIIYGANGADTFVFTTLRDSRSYEGRSDEKKIAPDILGDFTSGIDRIDLSAIDAIAATEADDAFTFIGTAAFTGTAGELRFEVWGDTVNIFADVNGDGFADLHIVANTPTIQPSDFFL